MGFIQCTLTCDIVVSFGCFHSSSAQVPASQQGRKGGSGISTAQKEETVQYFDGTAEVDDSPFVPPPTKRRKQNFYSTKEDSTNGHYSMEEEIVHSLSAWC